MRKDRIPILEKRYFLFFRSAIENLCQEFFIVVFVSQSNPVLFWGWVDLDFVRESISASECATRGRLPRTQPPFETCTVVVAHVQNGSKVLHEHPLKPHNEVASLRLLLPIAFSTSCHRNNYTSLTVVVKANEKRTPKHHG
jgi:hypothetical protein